MSLIIKFKNLQSGKKERGNVEWSDTFSSIIDDLKNAGLILDEPVYFLRKDNSELSQTETFQALGIVDKEMIQITTERPEIYEETENSNLNTEGNGFVAFPEDTSIPQQFHQLGIFVLDGSYSMNQKDRQNRTKREALNLAMKGIIREIKENSSIVDNLSFAVVQFGETASTRLKPTKVKNISSNMDFDPAKDHNKGTLVYTGLEKAEKLANKFLAQVKPDDIPHSVAIVLLSDGECHNPKQTIVVANRIKLNSKVTICTTFLSTPGETIPEAEKLMKKVASNDSINYSTTYDADSIRAFFIQSTISNFVS